MTTCPACHHEVHDDEQECRHCGVIFAKWKPHSALGKGNAMPVPKLFSFTGTGRDYFRIWIVNVLLTVATLGIYSAWAKVRRLQYFYRNTRVAGASFDYHGDPIAILKGRIIAVALLAGYYVAGAINPVFRLTAMGLIAIVLPWLLARALRFRLHNSSYRGIRFAFAGPTQSAYWVFVGLPVLSIFTLFTLVPFCHQRIKRYQHGNAAYGRTRFTFDAPVSGFYGTYIAAAMLSVGLLTVLGVLSVGLLGQAFRSPVGRGTVPAALVLPLLMFAGVYWLGGLGLRSFVNARVQNLVWRHTRLGPHAFDSEVSALRLFSITLTNLVATICTLGLFQPFAQVRLAEYMASSTSLLPAGSLDDLTAADEPEVTAVGEETAALFDFDIAL